MILADVMLRELIESDDLITEYGDLQEQMQPASFDLRLHNIVQQIPSDAWKTVVDPLDVPQDFYTEYDIKSTPYVLYPGQLILGATMERVKIPRQYVGMVNGRSTLGRLGLAIHITAGFIDPGFQGNITLEILNTSSFPIKLTHKMRIAQLVVSALRGTVEIPYGDPRGNNKYQGQRGATPPRKEKS